MLSILIPCYNYNALPLVNALHQQAKHISEFEILVFDDASDEHFKVSNRNINELGNCNYKELPKNIGRSKIRNELAEASRFENLLFLDADTMPLNDDFIQNYLKNITKDIVYGGVVNNPKYYNKENILRWRYMEKREQGHVGSANFLINKSVFSTIKFDESIKTYGYEDVVFFKNLKSKGYEVTIIDNPVIHNCNESARTYINKVEESLHTLSELMDKGILDTNDSKICSSYRKFEKLKLTGLIRSLHKRLKVKILKNLESSKPSLRLFDLYRLGYFSTIRQHK